MASEKTRCSYCSGTGRRLETHTETDFAMGIALGTALGGGFFPSTKTVSEYVNCSMCHGSGKR